MRIRSLFIQRRESMAMENEEKDLRQLIFELTIGEYDFENHPTEFSDYVDNEFGKGKPCALWYDEIFRAKANICRRLGVAEDYDVEQIISNFMDILNHISNKMYDYGMLFGYEPKKIELED